MWSPYEIDLSGCLAIGENKLELTLVNNLRNLMGPHHYVTGELFEVTPASFYKEGSPFNCDNTSSFTEKYCFVEMSV